MHDLNGGLYTKPKLERFGTFRDLTLIGSATGADISAVFGIPAGCNPNDGGDFGCGGGGRA
ncbi:MAG: lasso RiPP family leader peptide-containing protein [Gemmatimonadales bacterium]